MLSDAEIVDQTPGTGISIEEQDSDDINREEEIGRFPKLLVVWDAVYIIKYTDL